MAVSIERFDAAQTQAQLFCLVQLLQDVVNGGGTVGFMPPLGFADATAFWHGVIEALKTSPRVLLVARDGDAIVGTAQLDPCTRSNGLHRAEVMKVMVDGSRRNQGIGAALMDAIEVEARALGLKTLVLDTRKGEASERLYARVGYTRAGEIPDFAKSADGSLHTTVYMYKLLEGESQ
jgi:acetyltransferase